MGAGVTRGWRGAAGRRPAAAAAAAEAFLIVCVRERGREGESESESERVGQPASKHLGGSIIILNVKK